MNGSDVLSALRESRAWINYSPAKPFDFVLGQHPVTEEQLETELRLLYDRGFRGLVTNAMTYGVEAAPQTRGVGARAGFLQLVESPRETRSRGSRVHPRSPAPWSPTPTPRWKAPPVPSRSP